MPSTSPRQRWRSGSAGPSAPCAGAAWTSPATSQSCCACSTSSTRPATRAGWTWPARRSGSPGQLTLATEEPEARGLLALMLLEPRPAPGAARPRGPDRHARPAGPRTVGQARDRRGRARPAVGAAHADGGTSPGPLPGRGRDRRPARRDATVPGGVVAVLGVIIATLAGGLTPWVTRSRRRARRSRRPAVGEYAMRSLRERERTKDAH